MTQQQHGTSPYGVNQFGTPVNQFGTPVEGPGALRSAPAHTVAPYPGHPGGTTTDTVAVVGFVLAILFWPVGLGLSLWALRRTRRPGVDGRGWAVAGTVISLFGVATLLAAVAIPVVLNQRNKAVDADLQADLTTAVTMMESVRAGTGVYPTELSAVPLTGSTEQVLVRPTYDETGFCLMAHGEGRSLFMDHLGTTSTYGCP